MKPLKDRPYRLCVGILMFNGDGKVFVANRIDAEDHAWQMPQGGIDEGESPRDAALRELLEETGTARVEVVAESKAWINYDLPDDLANKVWKGRYRGQSQKWFAVKFLGDDKEIDIHGVEDPEFNDWQWVELKDLPDLIVPFKRDVYENVVAEFSRIVVKST